MSNFDLSILNDFKEKTSAAAMEFYMKSNKKYFNKHADQWSFENIDDPLIEMIENGLDKEIATKCRTELYEVTCKALENRPIAFFILEEMVEGNKKKNEKK